MISRPYGFGRLAQLGVLALCVVGHAQAQDVEIEVEAAPATPPAAVAAPVPEASAPPAPSPASASEAELTQLRAQVAALETKMAEAEARREADEHARAEAEAKRELEQKQERDAEAQAKKGDDLASRIAKLGVSISGYVQLQYSRNQMSEDQLAQGGTPLNLNRFAVRRGRLRVNGRWKYVRTDFELDGSNTRGPSFSVRRASLSGVLPASDPKDRPLLMLTVGLTEIPLGLELQQGQDDILFLERTTGSLAFFAGPVDTGAKLEGAYGPFRLQVAVMNGVPLDDRAGGPSGIDPTSAPDFLGRLGVDVKPVDWFRVAGGASFLTGKGFHPGSDATKSTLQWDDKNGDGQFSLTEVVQVAGRGALPSKTFDHWGVNADLEFDLRTKAGWTKLYGEATLASNLDRAMYVADPTLTNSDVREFAWYAALIQDVTQYGFVGARYDVYDPNSDLVDNRRGKSVPRSAAIKTLSPIAGVRWPGVARLTFEYDIVKDELARDKHGVPTDLKNNQWTLRAQGQF